MTSDARPAVTFPAAEHDRPFTGTKSHCLCVYFVNAVCMEKPTNFPLFTDAYTKSRGSKARFPLPELTGRQHGPSTRVVETGLKAFIRICVSICLIVLTIEPKRLKIHLPDVPQG